jgi:hypothetical protein
MNLEITPGRDNPIGDGRYLVFTEDDVVPKYTRPLVLLWHGGQWNYPNSSIKYGRAVFAFAGPLPHGKLSDLFPTVIAEQYFDEFTPMSELPDDLGGCDCSAGYSAATDHAKTCPKYSPSVEYDL